MVRAHSGRWLAACVVLALATLTGATAAFTVWWGWLVAGVLLAMAAIIAAAPAERRSPWITGLVIVGLLLGGAVFLLRSLPQVRPVARRSHCANNLRQIGIALHNYHDEYGTLPPPYFADETGRPMHSWRVLILPFLEERALYDRYDFDEPWDGPNNRLLAEPMPPVYQCPGQTPSAPAGEYSTNYAAILGPSTVWAEENRDLRALEAFSSTLLIVEAVEADIHWMEPRDVALEEFTAPQPTEPSLVSVVVWGFPPDPPPHPHGRNYLLADVTIRFLPFPLDPGTLAALAATGADAKPSIESLHAPPRQPNDLKEQVESFRAIAALLTVLFAIGFGIAVARIRDRR